MITLFENDEYEKARSEDFLLLKCEKCGNEFFAMKKLIKHELLYNEGRLKYCSVDCKNKNQQKHLNLNCNNCGKPIIVCVGKYNKSKTKKFYCSKSCSAQVNNSKRECTKEHRKKVSDALKETYQRGITKKGVVSNSKYKERICSICGRTYTCNQKEYPGSNRSHCSDICNKEFLNNRKYYHNKSLDKDPTIRERIRKGALHSVSVQSELHRSKNEIYFCELCEKYFKNVEHNKPIFNGWDADVIINEHNIAVLWNGSWHYKEISKSQSLLQIQNRDKIKIKEIKKHSYLPYIIRDDGKYNPRFVESEFKKFVKFIKNGV